MAVRLPEVAPSATTLPVAARQLQGLLLARAACLRSRELRIAAAEPIRFFAPDAAEIKSSQKIEDFGALPQEPGREGLAASWFGRAVLAQTQHEGYVSLYRAFSALPQGMSEIGTDEAAKRFHALVQAFCADAEEMEERGIPAQEPSPDSAVFNQMVKRWCVAYQATYWE